MSKKTKKSKTIRKERVVIVGLICFIAGYATHSLVISYQNFGTSVPQKSASVQPVAPAATSADDVSLLKKVENDPNDLNSWIQLGNLYFDTGNSEKAISAYGRALEIDPQNPDVQTDLGIMYRRTGQLAEAVKAFNIAREIDPYHQMSAYNKGIVFFYDMGNIQGALDIWKELLKENPNFF